MPGGGYSLEIIIKSFFPTLFANNWYMTCYLLFYPIHPLLNKIIGKMRKQQLLRLSLALLVLYFGFGFLKGDFFFPSPIIFWITIYFVMAYLQLYLNNVMDSVKLNSVLFMIGFLGFIGIAAVTNFLGLHIAFFREKILRWICNNNPCLLLMTVALFNSARKAKFRSYVINYVSSLSLLIYLIHENIILRTYFRPAMWHYIYQRFGYDHLILWVFVMVIVIFLFTLLCALVYDKTLRPSVKKASNALYSVLRVNYIKLEGILLKCH